MAVAPEPTTSFHQLRAWKRSAVMRQFRVTTAVVNVTAPQFWWNVGSGLRMRSAPALSAMIPPIRAYSKATLRK